MKRFLVYIPLAILVILVGLFTLTENYIAPFPYIDTHFAPGFSWEKYNAVQPGMSEEEVKQSLGEPLSEYISVSGYLSMKSGKYGLENCATYSDDRGKYSLWDFAWIAVNVCYGTITEMFPTEKL